jgi:hypothetical protein
MRVSLLPAFPEFRMVSQKPSRTRRLKSAESNGRKTPAPTLHDASPQHAAHVAEYIANMSAELAKMAGDARLTTLNYFLDMARAEAESQVYKSNAPPN